MCRELEVYDSIAPVFHTDDFILKVTVAKVTEKLPENNGKVTEKLPENCGKVTDKLIKKTSINGNKYLRRVGPDKGGFWEIIE